MATVTKEEEARARNEIEGRAPAPTAAAVDPAPKASEDLPAAGQHAASDLINPDATPGTGALPPPGAHDDVDSTSS